MPGVPYQINEAGRETVIFGEPGYIFPAGYKHANLTPVIPESTSSLAAAPAISTGSSNPTISEDKFYIGDTSISQHFHTRAAAIIGRAEKRRLRTRRARRMMGV